VACFVDDRRLKGGQPGGQLCGFLLIDLLDLKQSPGLSSPAMHPSTNQHPAIKFGTSLALVSNRSFRINNQPFFRDKT